MKRINAQVKGNIIGGNRIKETGIVRLRYRVRASRNLVDDKTEVYSPSGRMRAIFL